MGSVLTPAHEALGRASKSKTWVADCGCRAIASTKKDAPTKCNFEAHKKAINYKLNRQSKPEPKAQTKNIMMFSSKALLAVLAVASATPALSSCELEYVLFNSDTDEAVGVLQESFCIPDHEVNIQARPTASCTTTESALVSLSGPITATRTENAGPYMIFGDLNGNVFGRDLTSGTYTIFSDVFSEDGRQGDLVVSREFTFEAKHCKRGYVQVTNRAPELGTCQTPVWVGIHDGTFDTYDRNAPLPAFMEPLVEDGNNGPITSAFAAAQGGVWDGTVGTGPICAGETAYIPFEIELVPDTVHYFSYASMILPRYVWSLLQMRVVSAVLYTVRANTLLPFLLLLAATMPLWPTETLRCSPSLMQMAILWKSLWIVLVAWPLMEELRLVIMLLHVLETEGSKHPSDLPSFSELYTR